MRKSRVLLAGAAVAAAAVTTSAFTANNSGVDNHVAGYDEATVSGATVTDINYGLDSTDASLVDTIDFVATENVSGNTAYLQFTDSSGNPVGPAITCSAPVFTTTSLISCPTQAGGNKPLGTIDGFGLTVAQ